jgi:hypothetical protein
MSEYQYIAFRAIDGPVSEKNLAYMRKQSTRADITPWSFDNEYNFGDFRGNALEMLRRGYDIHLHYANFGIRSLFIRLPGGLPNPKEAAPYLDGESIRFVKDKNGIDGTLAIEPTHEPGNLEELWDFDEWLDRLTPLRTELLAGDLRPLYLAQLTILRDMNHDPSEAIEPPVPFGLGQPTACQLALAQFYELSRGLLEAAARDVPAAPTSVDPRARFAEWLSTQSDVVKNSWLATVMAEPDSSVRAELMTAFRKTNVTSTWPTIERSLSVAQLEGEAKRIEAEIAEKRAEVAARAHAQKLAKMARNPDPYLQETEKLAEQRTTKSYERAGALLAELREALAGSSKSDLADNQAWMLHEKHPRLSKLTSALRRRGFLPKKVAHRS